MATAQDIFDEAMGLMDEVNETTGETDTADTKEYKNRTLFILNILRGELYPYSDTFVSNDRGIRPIADPIEDFDTSMIIYARRLCRMASQHICFSTRTRPLPRSSSSAMRSFFANWREVCQL